MTLLKLRRLLGEHSRPVLSRLYSSTVGVDKKELKTSYDAVVIGAGHNGLVSAAYLQKQGLDVCVLERRHVIGGAAVTEEIVPGYKFSRASYVLSLLRPIVYKDLELKKYGLKVFLRDPNAYTPLLEPQTIRGQQVKSLLLGRDSTKNRAQIAQFSERDARKFEEFEEMLNRIVGSLDPILDSPPVHLPLLLNHRTLRDKIKLYHSVKNLFQCMVKLGKDSKDFYDLMTAPATKVLDKWFESEPLKATLATDAVIGAMISPETPGSGYVLLHHVMGELEGVKGAWGIVEGGMGSLSQAIANCAMDHGTSIFTNKPVNKILTQNDEAVGVVLKDGTEIRAKVILSNATPKVTFVDLLPEKTLPSDVEDDVKLFNYDSPVTKINVAVNKIPNFLADPNTGDNTVMPHHRCTIHINCEDTNCITEAYLDAKQGRYSKRPMIEMTIPSSLDPTIAPPGHHVVLLFTQYTPYTLADGQTWDDQTKNEYADTVFNSIEQYAPGFKESVVGRDILTPPDLEAVFGLTGGNIFHGAMSLDQLYMVRPTSALSDYRSPVSRLYLCGSGAHPGGGVMGSAGRIAALTVMEDRKKLKF
ncbi:LOW QUALITY PROTEIN: pyridine nucleotide-disulfide oxidoreductase domain-containing protein 2-like [Ruditapes philippinarum]|uniref:LOW QUALITY PROTEIN: pyridine nucleotide-disulfide oxidoreductase domain-containing protein 2-like n=1 Tax=Ruditapes philippinarum TaxID=129788 RepID=UPI00295B020E|nr:LOW QUALITY PROTEIN: pyridine nucleotide-disulfide oxidoreductase domain-containing protein 2-like [Ruditapes philippinarum]